MLRKKLLIIPSFQLNFIAWVVGLSLTLNVIYLSSHMLFLKYYFNKGEKLGLSHDHIFFKFLLDQYSLIKWIFLILSSVSTAIIVVWGLFLSNKIAGPIHRLCRHIDKKAQKNVSVSFKLRKNDYFKEELESAINKLM